MVGFKSGEDGSRPKDISRGVQFDDQNAFLDWFVAGAIPADDPFRLVGGARFLTGKVPTILLEKAQVGLSKDEFTEE
jgi:hypothetical protein